MKPDNNPKTKTEAAERKLTAKAKSILRKTDGLRVLKPGTVGYTIALSAVENALRDAVPAKPPTPAAGETLSLLGYGHVMSLGKFISEGTEARVNLEPISAYPDGPVEGDWMFPIYMGHPAADILAAARKAADSLPPVTDESPELRVIKFIERFDEKLKAGGFTLAQRHIIVGVLWTNSTGEVPTDTPRRIGMRDITVAIMDAITKETSDEVVTALSAACGRVREILGAVTLLPGEERMMTCPTCEGKQRLSPKEWCTRCNRSGIIPAYTNALAELVEAGMKPYAWENGLTGEISKDDDTGFMWELNRYDVTRLYTLPHPDDPSKG
jgi:hypothetical protein